MNIFHFLAELVGFSVCHQLPERSMLLGITYMPVCTRCSGLYVGFFLSTLLLFLFYRRRQSDMPPLYIIIISCLFIVSTFIDGFLSYLGAYETSNLIRIITGYLSGSGLAVFIFPVFIFQYYSKSSEVKIFNKPRAYILFISITLLFIAGQVLLLIFRPGYFASFFYYFNFFCIIFTFLFSNLVLSLLIPPFMQKNEKFFSSRLLLPLFIAVVLSFIELFISYRLHLWLQ